MNTNYHTHTSRCGHAEKDVNDYVEKAISSDYTVLGIADHAPMPISGMVGRMSMDELDDYLLKIEQAKHDYKDKIIIRSGLEIEYFRHLNSYYEALLDKMDYLLLAGHFYSDHSDFHDHSSYACNTKEKMMQYADLLVRAMKTNYFSCVVHPDLFLFGVPYFDDFIKELATLIIKTSIQTNTPLEYNANGIRRGKVAMRHGNDYRYPRQQFWEIAAQLNAPVILGADAHRLSDLDDDALEEAKKNMKALKLNIITRLPSKKEHQVL